MFIKCDHIWKKKLTNFHSFLRDAKKKLRLALCSADSVAFPVLTHSTRNGLPDHTDPEGELLPGSLSFSCIYRLNHTKSPVSTVSLIGIPYGSA